jgi:hypothetical protein
MELAFKFILSQSVVVWSCFLSLKAQFDNPTNFIGENVFLIMA